MKHPILTRLSLLSWQFGLIIATVGFALLSVFATPEGIKRALLDSDSYEAISGQLTASVSDRFAGNNDVPIPEETISRVAGETFDPGSIRATTEKTVDRTYAWLRGEIPASEVRIGTGAYIEEFSSNLSEQTIGMTDTQEQKPACSVAQLQQLLAQVQASGQDPYDVDTSALPCSPAGSITQLVGDSVDDTVKQTGNSELERSLRSQALPLTTTEGQNGNTDVVLDTAGSALVAAGPTGYSLLKLLPWLAVALAMLAALSVWLCNRRNWRLTLRALAFNAAISAVVVLVIAGVSRLIMSFLSRPDGNVERITGEFGQSTALFLSSLERAVDTRAAIIASIYLGLALIALFVLRRRDKLPDDGNRT